MTKLADEALIAHVAFILEAWDMKPPPNDFTGHNYRDIARDIIAALRQPDAVLGDLVERLGEEGLGFGIGPALLCQEAATAIQSLTAERDAALARGAEWRDHIIESGETFGLMAAVLHEFDAERFAQEIAVAELFSQSARAILEGSKP